MSQSIIKMNQSNFDQQVLQPELPVLVDYWAEWYAPCKAMVPALDEVAEKDRDRLRVMKIGNKVHLVFN